MYTKIITKTLLNPATFVMFLTACSPSEQTTANKVIAKVNGDKITLNQLSLEAQKVKISDSDQLPQKLINGLIDRQLLAQESLKLGLDRNLEVQEALAAAKAQIYAQAYIAQKVTKLPMPSDEEMQQFIDEHPEHFGQRKIVNTIDIVFENSGQKLDLRWLESKVTTLDALRKILEDNDIPFQTVNNRFSTDALPPEILDKIKQIKAGDLLFAHDRNKIIVKSVSSIEPSFILATQAQQLAMRMLTDKRRKDFITQDVNRLKALAKIEIFESNLTSVAGFSNIAVTTDQQNK